MKKENKGYFRNMYYAKETGNVKTNKKFMILSALGIIMVVDAHSWTSLDILTRYLPYNSFFMQLFVFISGYFFVYEKEDDGVKYFIKKIKKILIPYYFWWCFYAMFVQMIKILTGYQIGGTISIYNILLGPWLSGEIYSINNPSWFIITLFIINVFYYILRDIFNKVWNEKIIFFLFSFIMCICVYNIILGKIERLYLINIYRMLLLMPFYQFGVIYRKYIEKQKSVNESLFIIIIGVLISFVLVNYFGNTNFFFNSLKFSSGTNLERGGICAMIPFMTGLCGIVVWLQIASLLVGVLGNNRFIIFVSNNTFGIMMHHILAMYIMNINLVFVDKICKLTNFDSYKAKSDVWYRWNGLKDFNLVYFLSGLLGAMMMTFIVIYVKKYILNLFHYIKKKD